MAKWEIRYCCDVWGDLEEGWEVNDTMSIGTFDIPEDVIEDDKKLLEFLVEHTNLSTSDTSIIEVYGEYDTLEIREKETQFPLYWLIMVHYKE